MLHFTSNECLQILRMARRDYDSKLREVKYSIRRQNETGYPHGAFIAQDMRKLARLRTLIAHTKYELKEALNREIQAELKPRIWD